MLPTNIKRIRVRHTPKRAFWWIHNSKEKRLLSVCRFHAHTVLMSSFLMNSRWDCEWNKKRSRNESDFNDHEKEESEAIKNQFGSWVIAVSTKTFLWCFWESKIGVKKCLTCGQKKYGIHSEIKCFWETYLHRCTIPSASLSRLSYKNVKLQRQVYKLFRLNIYGCRKCDSSMTRTLLISFDDSL